MRASITLVIIGLAALCMSCTSKPQPYYETTWLEVTQTPVGYLIHNYSNAGNDEKIASPASITVRGDSLIWVTNSGDVKGYELSKEAVTEKGDSVVVFNVGNEFQFRIADPFDHIAEWKISNAAEDDSLESVRLYVDSRFNEFPIVDYNLSAGQEK